jgi:multicomponent Na+:H+ antiporter subunit F
MSGWQWAAVALTVLLAPCAWVCFRRELLARLVALELANAITVLILLMVEQAEGRSAFFDVALAMVLLSFGSGLVFTRFLERWL